MGLGRDDKKPQNISLKEAYGKIRYWYQDNIDFLLQRDDEYSQKSLMLVKALPSANAVTNQEIRAVLVEVISGLLEWAYHQSDDNYKMAAYAHAALESSGMKLQSSKNEIEQLKKSRLWPYLSLRNYY